MEKDNSKLHPAFRITSLAWLLSRTTIFAALFFPFLSRHEGIEPYFILLSDALGKSTATTPLNEWIRNFFHFMDLTYAYSGTIFFLVIGELFALLGMVGVYTYARKHGLPQVAERVTWFWALSPAMLAMMPGSPWVLSVSLVAMSFGLAVRRHTYIATLAGTMAIFISPELVLLVPALLAEIWGAREKSDEQGALTATIALPLSFVVTVFSTILLGDGVKAFAGPAEWRTDWSLQGLLGVALHPSLEWIVIGLVAFYMLLHMRELLRLRSGARAPRRVILALPAVLFPLLFVPSQLALGTLAAAIPTYLLPAYASDDPERERPMLVGSMLMLVVLLFYVTTW